MNEPKSFMLVLAGLDSDKKPHAARFAGVDAAVATKAAALMGFKIGRAESEAALALVKDLPEGKPFATGKALVPLVRQDIYDKLQSAMSFEAPQPTGEAKTGGDSSAKTKSAAAKTNAAVQLSDPWTGITVGSVILCKSQEKDDLNGYWESTVVSVSKDGESLTVKWKGYPHLTKFVVQRSDVGVLPSRSASSRR